MGERKVINKYLPPDFDPSLIPRGRKPKDGLVSVRMMLPFSIQCLNCSTFMYQGRKFNSKKENMQGPNGKYLGIQRYRFYIKCTSCAQPISFCTDPKNTDYEMESGASRNYELRKDKAKTEEENLKEEEEEEKEDPLKNLENRVLASQREMQDMDNLEEIKAMNMRHLKLLNSSGSTFDANKVLEARERTKKRLVQEENGLPIEKEGVNDNEDNDGLLTKEDEELIRSTKFGRQHQTDIKRLNEQDEKILELKRKRQMMMFEQQQQNNEKRKKEKSKMPVVIIKSKKRRRINNNETSSLNNNNSNSTQSPPPTTSNVNLQEKEKKVSSSSDDDGGGGLGGLLGGYGSDSSSDSN